MPHSSWHPHSSGPIPKGFRQRPKGWEGAKEGRQGERPYPEKAKRRPRAARHPGFAMLSLFQRKRVPPTAGTPPTSAIETPKVLMRPAIGRASCRERVCQSVSVTGVDVTFKQKTNNSN